MYLRHCCVVMFSEVTNTHMDTHVKVYDYAVPEWHGKQNVETFEKCDEQLHNLVQTSFTRSGNAITPRVSMCVCVCVKISALDEPLVDAVVVDCLVGMPHDVFNTCHGTQVQISTSVQGLQSKHVTQIHLQPQQSPTDSSRKHLHFYSFSRHFYPK